MISYDFSKSIILYVDDEEKSLKYFKMAFEDDYQILTASSVKEAIKLLDEQGPNISIVISDQRMPEEYGVVLLSYVRKHFPSIIRLLTTAYSDLDDAISAVNSGEIYRYISKPWNIDTLKNEILKALELHTLRQERELLVKQKLSVWQQMAQKNRLKDLVVMCRTQVNTKNTELALSQFISQINIKLNPLFKTREPDWSQFDFNDQIKEEIDWLCDLSKAIDRHVNHLSGTASNINIEALCKSSASDFSDLPIKFQTNGEIKTLSIEEHYLKAMIELLLSSLRGIARLDENTTCTIQMSGPSNNESVDLEIDIPSEGIFSANQQKHFIELFGVYLINYHLGGTTSLSMTNKNLFKFTLTLPLETGKLETQVLDENWLETSLNRTDNTPPPI